MKKCLPIILTALLMASTLTGCASPKPSDASAAYEKLIAYKTRDYGQQTVADFNASLASTPDELTEFFNAMTFSSNQLYCEHRGEELAFSAYLSKKSRPCGYLDDEGNTIYEFNCTVSFQVPYSINNPKLITVAERDRILLTYREKMQNYLDGLSEAEIANGNIKKMLMDKSAELENDLSIENMKLSPCDFYLIEINGEAE